MYTGLPFIFLLKGDGVSQLPTAVDTPYVECTYPADFSGVVVAQFELLKVAGWLGYTDSLPKFHAIGDEIVEIPVCIATDTLNERLSRGDPVKEVGPRFAFFVKHPLKASKDDPPEVRDAHASFDKTQIISQESSIQPPYDPRRASVWCVAAPGVKVTLPNLPQVHPAKIGVVRTQDPASLPPVGTDFELSNYLRTSVWVMMRGITGFELLSNPSPYELSRYSEPPIQTIEGHERPNGIDFVIRTGSHSSALAMKIAIDVDPASDKDRYWYGVEQDAGGSTARLRIAKSSNVRVKLESILPPGHKPPKDWSTWWWDYAFSQYSSLMGILPKSGPSDGYIDSAEFWRWYSNLTDYLSGAYNWPSAFVGHVLAKGNEGIGQVLKLMQTESLAAPFLIIEDFEGNDPVYSLPVPAVLPVTVPISNRDHPLHSLVGQLSPVGYTKDGFAGLFISTATGLPQPLAEVFWAVATGFVPLVGDAFDLVDGLDVLVTGKSASGTDAGIADYLALGIFALVSSGAVYSGLKKTYRASVRSSDYAAIVRRLQDEARNDMRQMTDMVASVKAGKKLEAEDVALLRRLLTGLIEDGPSPGLMRGHSFDDLIGDSGFKHPFMERLYRLTVNDDQRKIVGEARRRKAWLRDLPEWSPTRQLLTLSMGKRLAQIEFLRPPRMTSVNDLSTQSLGEWQRAIDEYVALLRPVADNAVSGFDDLAKLGKGDLDDLLELHGPSGIGLEFDYDRFPVEVLDMATPGIANRFRPGMPTNWPVERTIRVDGQSVFIGIEVPGYRGAARIKPGRSRVADEVERAIFDGNKTARWRISGNLLYFEKAKRLADPARSNDALRASSVTLPKDLNMAKPEDFNWKGMENARGYKGGWYEAVTDVHNPIGEIPDAMLDFQLLRQRFSPSTPRSHALPPLVEIDHEFIPQRVFYDLAMRGLVRDEVLVAITRKTATTEEYEKLIGKMMTDPEYLRAIRLKNTMNFELGQASGQRLVAKHREVHGRDDAYATARGVPFMMTRLSDPTYMRDMAQVPMDTIRSMIRELDNQNTGEIAPFLGWTINQEIMARNILIEEVSNTRIPRDFRAGLDEYAAAVEAGLDPDIYGYVGRQLPTQEDQHRYLRTGRWSREKYVAQY